MIEKTVIKIKKKLAMNLNLIALFSFLSYLVAALNKISLKNRINNVLKG